MKEWIGFGLILALLGGLIYSRWEVVQLRTELDGQWDRRVAAAKLSNEELASIPVEEKTQEHLQESSLRTIRLIAENFDIE